MGDRDDLDAAVDEVRAFNRMCTRPIGVLDYPGRLNTPYSLGEARILYELARQERTHTARTWSARTGGRRLRETDAAPEG